MGEENLRSPQSILKKTTHKEEMKTSILITALLLLLAANLFMMYVSPFGLKGVEGFQQKTDASGNSVMEMYQDASGAAAAPPAEAAAGMTASEEAEMKKKMAANGEAPAATPDAGMEPKATEGFASYSLSNAGGAKNAYEPIGAFDNIRLSTGNSISSWRYTAPNEPLMGPAFKPGDNELFIFKNNQCKPECCGASFSCGGGCVCTTPEQRDYINGRGGNRNLPDDAF